MGVFASKGYESASLTDLTDAMGINRVSLYATFGNKEALFMKALTRYTDAGDRRLASLLAGCSAREAVENLLRDSVRRFTDPKAGGVCFVTHGPLPEDTVSDDTRRYVARKREAIEMVLKHLLVRAVEDGELAREVSPTTLARFLSVLIQGLALQAQHGGTRRELLHVVDVAMAAWPTAHPKA
ncbi:TetR/AcrR family transcriptional regulator [Paraburkholderia sp. BL6665CI2N2]|uniref:TetR/AcrR family transcriptional regulator n=1 Tax=Paraburkholderia sp. BL6665CI2N2 TaxID=1938806 RepID=UPI001FBB1D58|nr:TetR/AcrR family transcriptional regulator [Paraburkholderia sp. BL6665CI2N2]